MSGHKSVKRLVYYVGAGVLLGHLSFLERTVIRVKVLRPFEKKRRELRIIVR
jgi:hypothetical protein